jgi:hypothetical protein
MKDLLLLSLLILYAHGIIQNALSEPLVTYLPLPCTLQHHPHIYQISLHDYPDGYHILLLTHQQTYYFRQYSRSPILPPRHPLRPRAQPYSPPRSTGKGHLDHAMRFLLDSDSIPNKSSEPIWLLGVQHTGNEPPPHPTPSRRPSIESRRSPSFRSTISSSATVLPDLSLTLSSSSSKNPANSWPPVFYADFTSRIWLTYRNQFAPIYRL